MLIQSVTAADFPSLAIKSPRANSRPHSPFAINLKHSSNNNNNNNDSHNLISSREKKERDIRAAEEYESLIMDFVKKYIEKEFVESTEQEKTPLYYYFRGKLPFYHCFISIFYHWDCYCYCYRYRYRYRYRYCYCYCYSYSYSYFYPSAILSFI